MWAFILLQQWGRFWILCSTVLPNPQDLDLKATFFKQTTDDFGEEFKGKFFVKIKRDSYLNDFITRTIASTNTWVSRDSAKVFSAKTWLLDQANSDAIVAGTNAADSSPLIRSILSIPPNSDYKLIDGSYDHFTTARSKFGKSISVDPDIAGQETYADVFASGQSRTLNGNGFNLNPESVDADDFTATKNGVDYTNGYSPVDWAATGLFNGSKIRLKFGGSTRGIMKSNQYSQNSINGLNMQFLNYDTPSLSGGSKTPRLVIDQTVGFRGTSSYNFDRPEPYVGDGWVVGNTFCSFKITVLLLLLQLGSNKIQKNTCKSIKYFFFKINIFFQLMGCNISNSIMYKWICILKLCYINFFLR